MSGFFIHDNVFADEIRKILKRDNPSLADILLEVHEKVSYGSCNVLVPGTHKTLLCRPRRQSSPQEKLKKSQKFDIIL